MTDNLTPEAVSAIVEAASAPLLARIAELEAENEHLRSQLNDDMARETKLAQRVYELEQQSADANSARDLWEDTAMKLKNNMAARQMGGERWHIVAAELRNLTARVESYERAEGNQP